MNDVHPIPHLRPANQGEDLVGGQIKRVQCQSEVGMLDEREEAEGAVLHPLQDHSVRAHPHLGFHECRELAKRPHVVAIAQESLTVGRPRSENSVRGVVKQINIVRDAGCRQQFVEGGASGNILLSARNAFRRQKAAYAALVGG
jgi:hypothetical protein